MNLKLDWPIHPQGSYTFWCSPIDFNHKSEAPRTSAKLRKTRANSVDQTRIQGAVAKGAANKRQICSKFAGFYFEALLIAQSEIRQI